MSGFNPLKYFCACVVVLEAVSWLPAEVPYPKCSQCPDPYNYGSYLFLPPNVLPNDYTAQNENAWKFEPGTGLNIKGAWQTTTGRPDVVLAILDSGIIWEHRETANKVALNTGELPFPTGCIRYDCNQDGVVNVQDYASVADKNGNGLIDAQDLIRTFSDGVDNDANGYVDDIAGWDFFENDNDPEDDVRFGHGTGQASDAAAEANNGDGFPGVAPNLMFIPLRVGDSFVAIDTDFAQALVYAVDRKVSLVSEALGTLTASETSQAAINYAYLNGIPLVASAADEESFHHNFPAAYEHSIWVNSIRNGDGNFVTEQNDYTILNGCTNYGGNAWVTISSISCSSEATGRAAGLVGLLVAHGKNLVDKGKLSPYPGLQTPFSAEEVRQILRWAAQDIDQSANLSLSMSFVLRFFLNSLGFPAQPVFGSSQFPTQAGWDQYTGYGRPDAAKLVSIAAETIPPEADLSGGFKWFATLDPGRLNSVPVIGSVAAVRAPGTFNYKVEVGCGVQPTSFTTIGSGASSQPLREAELAQWDLSKTVAACSLKPGDPVQDPDADTVTLRLQVTDSRGNVGEDRRTVAIHSDRNLKFSPIPLSSSAESSPVLADINRDGVLDIAYATSDGAIHATSGSNGRELQGFPAWTDALPVHPSPAYSTGLVQLPREPVLGSVAADDLDGDGTVEVVAASTEGKVYVFDDHARLRPGFPVSTDPALSQESNRDPYNDVDPGIIGAPTLADLDGPGSDPGLEIIVGALDRHVYAWRASGDPVSGFPVLLADPSKVTVGAGGRVSPKDPAQALPMPAKIVGSPAVGDQDGEGFNEIVAATNEQYSGESTRFALDSRIAQIVDIVSQVKVDVMGRVYAIQHDGNRHSGGPFRPGWPAPVPILVPGFLPTLGTGTPGSPAIADLDGSGKLSVAIFSAAGPVALWDADAKPVLGTQSGAIKALVMDFPGGNVPDTAGSPDAPFVPVVGSGALGDITGDNLPEFVAPTAGIRAVFDMLSPGQQEFSDHQITAWNPRTGELLPAFPRIMDDLMFLTSPALADVDGDGKAEILQGSGGYLLRAYSSDGKEPSGWPKFTHGWILATPVAGDVDGDGLTEVVATTREGQLYVWDTPAEARAAAIPWQGFGRDRRHTQNLSSGVSPLSPARSAADHLLWSREAAGRGRLPVEPRQP